MLTLFNNGSILEINDYCNNGSRGKLSLTELSEIINTLSIQEFAGLDKFKLRTSVGKVKEMRLKMNKKKNKNNRNESRISDFLSFPSIAVESASLKLDKRYCVKSFRIRSYSGPLFPIFGLNTERWGIFLGVQSECGKMRTRITPNTNTFHAVRESLESKFFRASSNKISSLRVCYKVFISGMNAVQIFQRPFATLLKCISEW